MDHGESCHLCNGPPNDCCCVNRNCIHQNDKWHYGVRQMSNSEFQLKLAAKGVNPAVVMYRINDELKRGIFFKLSRDYPKHRFTYFLYP